VSCREPQR